MTNQEAIETLKTNYPDACFEQLREAVDTAISALQAQDVPDTNAGDTISRRAAVDAPKRFTKDCNPEHFVGHSNFIEYMDTVGIRSFGNWQYANGFNMGLTAAEVAIEKLPSAQRKGKWLEKEVIPVYENGFTLQSCKCSECNRYDTRPYMYFFVEPMFCSHCGAEMKGESGEESL